MMENSVTENASLFRQPRLLDRTADAGKRVKPVSDWSFARNTNALPLTAPEFFDACREFIIGFVDVPVAAGQPRRVAPLAIFGLRMAENLFIGNDGAWDARYIPAGLRAYPFVYVRGDKGELGLAVDDAYEGLGTTEGELLIGADGQASAHLTEILKFLDALEAETQRTQAACARLLELDLLAPRSIEGKLPNGEKVEAHGFSVVDEQKLRALPDDVVLELHRNGLLALIQAHLISLGNHQGLFQRMVARAGAA